MIPNKAVRVYIENLIKYLFYKVNTYVCTNYPIAGLFGNTHIFFLNKEYCICKLHFYSMFPLS